MSLSIKDFRVAKPNRSSGNFCTLYGKRFYKISNYDALPPFFMTVTGASDVWIFISSSGGLTAGRKDEDHALFAYGTSDKISDSACNTGSRTILRIADRRGKFCWEPFTPNGRLFWKLERNLYKDDLSSHIVFEEINRDLCLRFRLGWTAGDKSGLVRTTELENFGRTAHRIDILDGCVNIMPSNISAAFQNTKSVLADAYKKTEIDGPGIGIFSVSSIPTDRAEPNECLTANISFFDTDGKLHCTEDVLPAFRRGEKLPVKRLNTGGRGALLLEKKFELPPKMQSAWKQVFDTDCDHAKIGRLKKRLADRAKIAAEIETDLSQTAAKLENLIESADGIQHTGSPETDAHHKANVIFNLMRGGAFAQGEILSKRDFLEFAAVRNRKQAEKLASLLAGFSEELSLTQLRTMLSRSGDRQSERLGDEYLPLSFSRRHGDPSRPWNKFQIELHDESGRDLCNYQGNWRDIFQNWESLAYSYPAYLPNMIAKFLNAVTIDGYNPYRITRDGLDWEIEDSSDPWSFIGYWGDHQIVYLERLLEQAEKFDAPAIVATLNEKRCATANIPYRLKSYAEILAHPKDSIFFDATLNEKVLADCTAFGTDAKLIRKKGEVVLVSPTVKFLLLAAVKMANFVPGGGIWLNTQRPEWNDANNALAGFGLSMVTACYLRRFLVFLRGLYAKSSAKTFDIPGELAAFLRRLAGVYAEKPAVLDNDSARRKTLDENGEAYEHLREAFYRDGYGEDVPLEKTELDAMLSTFQRQLDWAISRALRPDKLYDAYNVMTPVDGKISLRRLSPMLEGQVAALSSRLLKQEEAATLLKTMRKSPLYDAARNTYLLYPPKILPDFCATNRAPLHDAAAIPLLAAMLKENDSSIVVADGNVVHFRPEFHNSRLLSERLAALKSEEKYPAKLFRSGIHDVAALYEKTFHHGLFTGRSCTFYAYEGIGSVYWHMVSKLLLAVQENALAAEGQDAETLKALYYDIRDGLGFHKTPAEYGAFPCDPYSHTPSGRSAQQPGMTGQVKEEILTRFGELGLVVSDGRLSFAPKLLSSKEFQSDKTLNFTYCGQPIQYCVASAKEKQELCVFFADGSEKHYPRPVLDAASSQEIFHRTGKITALRFRVKVSR